MRSKPWWEERIVGAFMSYWIYQHLGNLSPEELEEYGLFERVHKAQDASRVLREFAYRADRETGTSRWSFHRDFGRVRLIVMDTRAGRVLEEGHRSMLNREEWTWIEGQATGDFDHLLFGTSSRCSWPPACTTSRRGTKPSAGAPGAARPRSSASSSASSWTWSTGLPSTTPSRSSRRC